MCSDLFHYDPTDEEPEHVTPAWLANAGKGGRLVITGQTDTRQLVAGLDPRVADQLVEIVFNLAKVLVGPGTLTAEEACKKIRWATHVIESKL